MLKITRLDEQCEDRCIIGRVILNTSVLEDYDIIYDGDSEHNRDTSKAVLYNFCPGCGQELNVKHKVVSNGRFITFKKES
jgi:hypothetical protein